MTRHCKAPDTIDREGGDCADPTCRAHDINEDGPNPPRPTMPCGCDGAAQVHTCNAEHDTACQCELCQLDPYVDPAGPAVPPSYPLPRRTDPANCAHSVVEYDERGRATCRLCWQPVPGLGGRA